MLYRIVAHSSNFSKSKTMVVVELLEQLGPITKIAEKLQFEVDGTYESSNSMNLMRAIGKILIDSGFSVVLPPAPEEEVKADLPDFPKTSPGPQ